MVVAPKLPDLKPLRTRLSMTMHARLNDLLTLCDPPNDTLGHTEVETLGAVFKELSFLTESEETLRTMILRFGKGEAYCPRCMRAAKFVKEEKDSIAYECPADNCGSVFMLAKNTTKEDEEE